MASTHRSNAKNVVNRSDLHYLTLMERLACVVLERWESRELRSRSRKKHKLGKGLTDKLNESNLTQTMLHCSCKLMIVFRNVRCSKKENSFKGSQAQILPENLYSNFRNHQVWISLEVLPINSHCHQFHRSAMVQRSSISNKRIHNNLLYPS